MELSRKILNDLADSLECGFKCYIHKDTFQVVTYLDSDQFPDADPQDWKDEIGTVRKYRNKFIEIEPMGSSESFKMMKQFLDSLEDNSTKIRLLVAMEGRKPFANFKRQIENSGDYRDIWFTFRREKYIEWIQTQLGVERQ